MLRVYLIAGLGGLDKSFQPLIDFVKRVAPNAPLMIGVWNNAEFLNEVVLDIGGNPDDKFLLIGHSFGGWRAIELADGHFGYVPMIDRLIVLDPKPHDFWPWLQMDHYKFPVPQFAKQCISIHSGFGADFVDAPNAVSIKLEILHASFPADEQVQELIGVNIAELLEAA